MRHALPTVGRSTILATGLATAALMLAGCASSGGSTPPAASPAHTSAVSSSSAPPTAGSSAYSSSLTVTVTEANNHGAVTVHPGTDVVVVLSSTYWTFAPVSAPKVLAQSAPRVHAVAPGVRSVPGSGKGTVQETFRARAPGSAVITAARMSCGEAMRCSPAQSAYRITVTVR